MGATDQLKLHHPMTPTINNMCFKVYIDSILEPKYVIVIVLRHNFYTSA